MKDWRWRNQYIALIEEKRDYLVSIDDETQVAAAREVLRSRSASFERIFCELGSGSGGHLIEIAARDERAFFVGFELRFKRCYRTAEKAEARALKNIVVVRGDAARLPVLFPPGSIAGVYVNFPDPWDKRRWSKHRMLNQSFLEEIVGVLRMEGFLSYKTDHSGYFDQTVELVKLIPQLEIVTISRNFQEIPENQAPVYTEFEQLFRSQDLPIHHLLVKKIGN